MAAQCPRNPPGTADPEPAPTSSLSWSLRLGCGGPMADSAGVALVPSQQPIFGWPNVDLLRSVCTHMHIKASTYCSTDLSAGIHAPGFCVSLLRWLEMLEMQPGVNVEMRRVWISVSVCAYQNLREITAGCNRPYLTLRQAAAGRKPVDLGLLISCPSLVSERRTRAVTCTEHHENAHFVKRTFSLACTTPAAWGQGGCSPEVTRRDRSKVCLYLLHRG